MPSIAIAETEKPERYHCRTYRGECHPGKNVEFAGLDFVDSLFREEAYKIVSKNNPNSVRSSAA